MPNIASTPSSFLSLIHPKWWLFWVFFGLFRVLVLLPFSWQINLSKGLGWLMRKFVHSRSLVIKKNLQLVFPEKSAFERAEIERKQWQNLALFLFESMLSWSRGQVISQWVDFENIDVIHKANAQGKGVVILGMHMFPMELVGIAATFHMPVSINYRVSNNPVIEYVSKRGRQKYFDHVQPKENLRWMIRYLRTGGNLWYAPDQYHAGGMSGDVRVFGHSVKSPTALADLARLGKAATVIVLFHREGLRYKVRFLEPLDNFPSGDDVADTQRYYDLYESHIREYPEQYLWAHKRFKNVIDY